MYNDLFTIGNIHIYSYGVCIALGIIAGFITLLYRMKKYNQEVNRAIDMMLVAVLPGFVGAKLNYWIVNIKEIIDKKTLIQLGGDGFVIYGGVLFGMIGVFIYLKKNKLNIPEYMDTGIASVAIAQGFGRIGCFMAGCCFGMSYSGPLAVTFHHSQYAPNGYSLFPTQLAFALADFVNFGILCFSKKHNKIAGRTMVLYMITYGIGRFFLEFLRGDSARGTIFGMSTAQFTSICITIVGCTLYGIITTKAEKKEGKSEK